MLQARCYWPHIAAFLVVSLLSTPLTLLMPVPLRLVVDSVLGSRPIPPLIASIIPPFMLTGGKLLAAAAILNVAVVLLVYLQSLTTWLLQTYVGERVSLDFKARLFRHIQRLSLSFHDARGTADSIYRIQYDALSIRHIAVSGVIPFVSSAVLLTGMIWVMATIDWTLAAIALAVVPVLYALTGFSRRLVREEWSKIKEMESSAMSVVHEVLNALRVVKAFGAEDFEQKRFLSHSDRTVRGQLRLALFEGGFDVFVGLTIAIGAAAVLVIGALHVQRGGLTVGQLLMVMTYVAQLYAPLETIGKTVTQLQSSFASAHRAFSILDEAPDVYDRPDAWPLPRAAGHLTFQNVSFSYDGARPVLQGISFDAPPCTCVGLIGASGSGKTTLLKLLTRFYDPTAGRILLDGIDLRDYRLRELRRQFAIVLQDSVLFSTSIAENIAYARPDARELEIVAAARAAHAHEFITKFRDGYGTTVGERGAQLSGGQRQRVSIARAFLKQAPILILDEPTSSVDAHTESLILAAMEDLMRGRTTFIVTHRASLLRHCDLILHLEQGRLVKVVQNEAVAAPALS
jgi:ATP-binding cassette, subfamily B, bacterial